VLHSVNLDKEIGQICSEFFHHFYHSLRYE